MLAMKQKNYQFIELTEQDDILTVALNRPDKKNAMNFAMMRELIDLATRLKRDKSIRAVIITGSGNAFCSGIDLGDLTNPKNAVMGVWQLVKPTQSLFQRVCLVWREVPVPVFAALHGYCIGAGLQLALACDIRISTPDCQMAIMEAKWGLVPDMGLTQSAFHVVRADVLKELAMTGRMLDGQVALEFGLVSHVDGKPLERAKQLAHEVATRSPDAVLACKKVINHMTKQGSCTLYKEKIWQLKLMVGKNRKRAIKRAKDSSVQFLPRQFR